MGRIAAFWIVALVADKHSFWNFTIMNLIGESVGFPSLAAYHKHAVPASVCGAQPIPARLSFFNLLPKILQVSFRTCHDSIVYFLSTLNKNQISPEAEAGKPLSRGELRGN